MPRKLPDRERLGLGSPKRVLVARTNGEGPSTQGKPVRHYHRRVIRHLPSASLSGQAYVRNPDPLLVGGRGAVRNPYGTDLWIAVGIENSERLSGGKGDITVIGSSRSVFITRLLCMAWVRDASKLSDLGHCFVGPQQSNEDLGLLGEY